MPLHYTKSGSLDMRYSSSRAAVGSSGGGGGNSSSGGGGYFSSGGGGSSSSGGGGYSSSGGGGGGLHYTKSGALDMRYSSSKAAVGSSGAGGGSSQSSGGGGGYSRGDGGGFHYTKSGALDMRYSSSQAPAATSGHSREGLTYKKDGTLDMRYSSSKSAAALSQGMTQLNVSGPIHNKKDGTPDMRYSSSKQGSGGRPIGIPTTIPLTKSGLPDMRTRAAKVWVASQSQASSSDGGIPSWLPRKKDGTLDNSKAVVQEFYRNGGGTGPSCRPNEDLCADQVRREQYWKSRMATDDEFNRCIREARTQPIEIRIHDELSNTRGIAKELSARVMDDSDVLLIALELIDVKQIKYSDITFSGTEEECILGRGAFGVVLRGTWDKRIVAVKRLHLTQLTKREKPIFLNELRILAALGDHPNLVKLYAYSLEPPALVMEFIRLGSLNHLLHYCEEPAVEAKMCMGIIKKKLMIGIAQGMAQLHAVGVVHSDLKPHNVLVTDEYDAKITDFGLATLRGKTSSSVASTAMDDGEKVIGGTAGYMAPELLDSSQPPEFSSDVYSFAIVLNEVIQEEEPFTGQERNFQGRGNFGAANYARLGHRPVIHDKKTPAEIKALIQLCWSRSPARRPNFKEITKQLERMAFPNSF